MRQVISYHRVDFDNFYKQSHYVNIYVLYFWYTVYFYFLWNHEEFVIAKVFLYRLDIVKIAISGWQTPQLPRIERP